MGARLSKADVTALLHRWQERRPDEAGPDWFKVGFTEKVHAVRFSS